MKTLTGIIAVLVILSLGGSLLYLTSKQHETGEWFISHDHILGSAAIYGTLPFTLNYEQQETLASLLNGSKKLKIKNLQAEPSKLTQIILYRFEKLSDLVLTPVKEDLSLFSVSGWETSDYLKISSPKALQDILTTACSL